MNIKFLTLVLSLTLVGSTAVRAEDADDLETFGLEITEEISEPNVAEQPQDTAAAALTDEANDEQLKKEQEDMQAQLEQYQAEISFYIQNMELTAQQLHEAKEINEEGRLRQEQLLNSINQLQEQIKAFENQNLERFKDILTPEQKEAFARLRASYENSQQLSNILAEQRAQQDAAAQKSE